MNENIASNIKDTRPDLPISLKTSRLINKKLKALDRFEKRNGRDYKTLLERGKITLKKILLLSR